MIQVFEHIPVKFRGKVAHDFLAHLDKDRRWDAAKFNPLNDYQRHLYALFLRLADFSFDEVWVRIHTLASDVGPRQRGRYVDDVLHSQIVGFPKADGGLVEIPDQEVEERPWELARL